MQVKLNKFEQTHITTTEIQDVMNSLGLDEEGAVKTVDGSRLGAIYAVAKAINVYPPFGEAVYTPLVSRTRMPIGVVWHKDPQTVYTIRRPVAEIYFMVSGIMPTFEVHGWALRKHLLPSVATEEFQVFHHVLAPLDRNHAFLELIHGSRKAEDVYVLKDNQWVPKS